MTSGASAATVPVYVILHTLSQAPGPDLSAIADYNYGGVTGSNFEPAGGTATGTVDATGTLTSAFMKSVTDANNGTGIKSTAYASGDLATGSVHLNASDNATCNGICDGVGNYASETASAEITDALYFTVAGAGADTVTPITVTFTVEGNFYPNSDSIYGDGALISGVTFGAASTNYDLNFQNASTPVITNPTFDGWESGQWLVLSTSEAEFQGVFDLLGPSQTVDIELSGFAQCGYGATCDYDDTGEMGLVLPAGVSFTSESGAFLTAVPEPSTWAMMLAGLAGLVFLARCRTAGRSRLASV